MPACLELPFGFVPGWDWVMVRPIEDPTVPPSGLLRVRIGSQGLLQWGEVVAVGPAGLGGVVCADGGQAELDVRVGDTVFFNSAPGVAVQYRGEPVILVQEHYLMGVLER